MPKKKVKRFDVWVTRNHFSDMGMPDTECDDKICVSDATSTTIIRNDGCCFFVHMHVVPEDISRVQCRNRYEFLPRPGECWNVWNTASGIIYCQEYPVLEWYDGTLYKKVSHRSEQKHYL